MLPTVDLWPLYDERDYHAFTCLFGVRNQVGFHRWPKSAAFRVRLVADFD